MQNTRLVRPAVLGPFELHFEALVGHGVAVHGRDGVLRLVRVVVGHEPWPTTRKSQTIYFISI